MLRKIQKPLLILERGKGVEEIASSSLLFKKKRKREVWVILDVYALELNRETSLILKWSCLRLMLLWNVMVYSLCMRLLVWEGLCVRKRENLWRMVHSSRFMFWFQFHEFYLLIERQTSPQAYLSIKIWEIEAKVGRLCQNFCKFMSRKLQQHKQAPISS